MSILTFKNSNPTILIKHGNYITAYKNMSKVYVKKGQRVISKQKLGEIFTNEETGKTILQFSVFNGMSPENPDLWLFQWFYLSIRYHASFFKVFFSRYKSLIASLLDLYLP